MAAPVDQQQCNLEVAILQRKVEARISVLLGRIVGCNEVTSRTLAGQSQGR